ncbi:hypothetical protein Ddye_008121 [Dipteronia dyeriana]|uniref:RNase H type-1 domain-containing protein n=1 Tax=Dipteronia dyeriana TaxID=168575 RepID=A0AAD9X8Z2_9ROSI|nr:hypothetical protein Ddye_008121 [Dipteronia dyeriana]
MKSCCVSWSPPSPDWVKLNVDGSMMPESEAIFVGGVVRGHRKSWMVGFSLNKSMGSILKGLKLVWKAGYRKIIVESGSQVVVAILNQNASLNHPLLNIILACKLLITNE